MGRTFGRGLIGLLSALVRLTAAIVALVLLVCAMILVQGRRDEARPAGAAIVVLDAGETADAPSARAQLDRASDLFRRGVVSRIVFADRGSAAASAQYLAGQGVPPDALLAGEGADTLLGRLEASVAVARGSGVSAGLIVAHPWSQLRALKIARDQGLIAYGVPARAAPTSGWLADDARMIVREAWAYLGYLFLRQ